MDVWCASKIKLQKSVADGHDFKQIVEIIFEKCDTGEIQQFVGIARKIWLQRNEVVHGGGFAHPNAIIQWTAMAMEYFSLANYIEVRRDQEASNST